MLKWKKSNGEIATDSLSQNSSSTEVIDLTWVGHLANLEEALLLAQQAPAETQSGSTASSASPGAGANVDLTASGNFGAIGEGLFVTAQVQPAGTGGFNTFVQIQANGSEQGYNTDHRPQQFNERDSAQHNHSLLLSNIPIVFGDGTGGTNEGTAYREFRLDANEPNGGGKNFLSLDRLQIFQETSGNLTGFTPGSGFGAPGEDLIYDLDDGGVDRWVALNASLSSGSGSSDMRLLIPNALFDPNLSHVVVYSGFGYQGNGWTSEGGFEEWGVDAANSPGGGGGASLNITMTSTVPGGTADVGETIAYAINLKNTGSINLTGVTVTDPFVTDLTRIADLVGNNDAVLNTGETWRYTASHTVTQADIDATEGFITNQVTADSLQTHPVTAPDTSSTFVPIVHTWHATLIKAASVPGGTADTAGETITYGITLTNDGNTTLTNPVVTDPAVSIAIPVLDFGAPVLNLSAPLLIPVLDGDYNAGDTNENGTQDPAIPPGPGNPSGTPAEVFQFANAGDENQNSIVDNGEVWQFSNIGDTNQNGSPDPGETFQYYNAGDTNHDGDDAGETWQFTFSNGVAQILMASSTFNVGDTNQDGNLSVGESWQYTASRTVTQDDIDNGGVVQPGLAILNTATGTTEQADPATDSVSVTIEQRPETVLAKNATVADGTADEAGDVINYTIAVTNTGNMTLTNPVVSDDAASNLDEVTSGAFNIGDTDSDGKLDLLETWQYTADHTLTQDEIDNGGVLNVSLTVNNTASVLTDQGAASNDSASVSVVQSPSLSITKEYASGAANAAGDVITYAIAVSNTGNMTLTDIAVTDPTAVVTEVASFSINLGDTDADGKLDLTETWFYSAAHTVTQAEMDAGTPLANTATADSAQTTPQDASSDPVAVNQNAQLAIAKAGAWIDGPEANGLADPGEQVHYTFAVTNDGNVTLNSVSVTDSLVTPVADLDPSGSFNIGDTDQDGNLDVGETWTYSADYTIDGDNTGFGSVQNDALASALGPQAQPASDEASVVTTLPNSHLTLTKSGSYFDTNGSESVDLGDHVNYSFMLANDGYVSLTGPEITDSLVASIDPVFGFSGSFNVGDSDVDDVLDVGETWSYTAAYALTSEDVTAGMVHNEADATAVSAQGQTPTSHAEEDVFFNV